MLDTFKILFINKLDLEKMSPEIKQSFLESITRYLDHGRKEVVNGRTIEFVEKQLDSLMDLLLCMGYNKEEIVRIITNLPSLLNTVDDLYKKYLFLGVIENADNTLRKDKLLNKTKDYMVGFNKMYARYKLACEAGYDNLNWNLLVHASDSEYAKVFVKGSYEKPYQMFTSIEQVFAFLEAIDTSDFDFEVCKGLDVNKEFVSKYEERNKGK